MKKLSNVTRAVIPALLLTAGITACNTSAADEPSSAPEVARVERRSLEVTAEAAGAIEPIRVVEVKSKASGEVTNLLVETGDVVGRGDLLVEIDPRDVRNAEAQASADLDVAEARLKTAVAQRERIEELRKANVATEQELETALLDEANAKAQRIKAKTSLELAQERLGDVAIRAPINGTIIARAIEIGTIIASASNNVSGGTTLLTMADLSEMQVRALVDETDLGRIAAGQQVHVSVEAYPQRRFAGRVLKIEPQAIVDQNVTMFPVLVRLDNREGLLRPGMNADVQVEIARRDDVVTVPNAAVVSLQDARAAGEVLGLDEATVQAALRGGRSAGDGQETRLAAASPEELRSETDAATRLAPTGGESDAAPAQSRAGRAARVGSGVRSGPSRGDPDARPGVVFVQTEAAFEPRRVMLGLNDWDYTEIVSGLEPDERVVLMSVARLQQAQEEFLERMRERTQGPFPSSGR
ncbi:MAG: efflux RND transporter periplasmic adaptor subunit [Longimicrobiales bacterium]